MSEKKAAPNTYMGEVAWFIDPFWGELLFLVQSLCGICGPLKHGTENELDTTKYDADHLQEYFEEEQLSDGRLRLLLFSDQSWHSSPIASIETSLLYEDGLSDEVFMSILNDFLAYVRSLPLADMAKGDEGREERMQAMGTRHFEFMMESAPKLLEAILLADLKKAQERKPWDDVEF